MQKLNRVFVVNVKLLDGNWIQYRAVNGLSGLKRLIQYFDRNFVAEKKWLFCNVYDKETKQQIANYLNGKNPTRP